MSSQIISALKRASDNDPAVEGSCSTTFATTFWVRALSAATLLSSLGLIAVLLLCRRLAGALHEPLATSFLIATAFALAAAAMAARLTWKGVFLSAATDKPASVWPWLKRLFLFGPTVAVFVAGVSLCVAGTSVAGQIVFWSVLAVEEFCSLAPGIVRRFAVIVFRPAAARQSKPIAAEVDATAFSPVEERLAESVIEQSPSMTVFSPANETTESPAIDTGDEVGFTAPADVPSERVTQQLVRHCDVDGTETISGWVRAQFVAGQRMATVHIAFCPPFPQTPVMEVVQVDGPSGRIKTVQLLPYGARLDLKLQQDATEALSALLQFSAHTSVGRSSR